jgi:FKBP-type peptidyl-prolyl cis-trans isomerase SlpA
MMTSRDARCIGPRSRVTLHLSITLDDGTEALSSFNADPISFTLGDGTLAPGLEALLLGLPVGTDTLLLAEGAAVYGAIDPALVQDLPRTDLPTDFEPRPGQVIAFDTPGGQEAPGTVVAVSEEQVRIDFNHPLARRGLRLQVHVLTVE